MRESRSYGSAGERQGNEPLYPDGKITARGTRTLSGRCCVDEFAKQNEFRRLHEHNTINSAGIRNGHLPSYNGRCHRCVETAYDAELKQDLL